MDLIRELGMETTYFPLYAREPGRDTALAALFTSSDFYMLFLADRDKRLTHGDQLSISESSILRLGPMFDCLNIPGANFMGSPVESMVCDAESHGNAWETRLVREQRPTCQVW